MEARAASDYAVPMRVSVALLPIYYHRQGIPSQQKTRTRRACVLVKAQGEADFTASYNNQIGRPVGIYSGTIGGLVADAVLVPAAFVAVTEQL